MMLHANVHCQVSGESNEDGVNEKDGRKFLAAAHHMIYGHETYIGFQYSHSLDHH